MKEIKKDFKSLRDIPFFWIGKLNVVKMLIFPKIDNSHQNFKNILGDKFILRLIWKGEVPGIVKTTQKKKRREKKQEE